MNIGKRKLMWSVPLIAAVAVIGALAIFIAQAPGTALAHDPPGVVGNLTGEADGQNAIDLSWDAPATGGTPTSYRIDRSENGNVWTTHKMGHTMRTFSDTGLKSGKSYYYRVFAVNSAGTGPVSPDFQVQTDVGAPTSGVVQLRATAMGQNQINLTWSEPADLNGSPVEKYFIHFGSGDSPTIPLQTAGADDAGVIEVKAEDGTSYEHKMLTAATRYSYVVYAENGTSKSTVPSNTAAATTEVLVKPGAPTGLVASQATGGVFSLYWHAPTNTGGTAPIGYPVQVSYNGRSFVDITPTTAWLATATTVSADATFTVTGDIPGVTPATPITNVRFRVYAVTRDDDASTIGIDEELKSDGYSIWPASGTHALIADADHPARVPGAPTFAAPANATRDSKGNVNLTWTAPTIDGDDDDLTNNDAPDSIGGYRIDVSDDGVNWRGLVHHTRKTSTEFQYVDTERKSRSYRISAWHAQYLGPAQEPVVTSTLQTATVVNPGHVTGFTATAVSPSQIDLAWMAPANDGGADVSQYFIAGVRQATGGTFAAFPTAATTAEGELYATSKTTGYMHKELNAGETWQYRVLVETDDGSDTGNLRTSPDGSAATRRATTPQADLPEAPEGLTAEDAKDSSLTGIPNRGVLLLWNAPDSPDGANIDGYRIQRKKGDAAWETLVMDTGNVFTDYTDPSEPAADEMRMYQVAALNGTKVGAYSDPVYYPYSAMAHDPGMPTGVMAEKVAEMPTSQIKVSWSAPASGVADGYIIERRYGDMMMDIPSDGYSGTDGANRNHAFMNYKEWWETLNCKGMLAAAGSSETEVASPAADSDQAMYCANFLNTAPTNVTDSSMELSAAAMAKVKELFMKRYVANADGTTMTMFTGMMHTDMNLMASTEYTYRVRAIHGMTASPWSTAAMATTGPTVMPVLTAPSNVMASHTGPAVTIIWEGGENADTFAVAMIRRDAADNWDIDNAVYDTGVTGSPHTVNMVSRPAGTYHVFVIAGSADEGWSAWVAGTLEYAP